MNFDEDLERELNAWADQGLSRCLRPLDRTSETRVLVDGREVLCLASNNYLGLANHPAVCKAAIECIQRVGLGAGGARLTTGNYPEHEALERELAAWKGVEDTVLFDSGYAANTGVIPALVGKDDLILSDVLNHASLVDGCRLSRATIRVYAHRDVESAAEMLTDRARFRRRLIVTDGVFSMDGDLAPLVELCTLAVANYARLLVDDAHGTGVMGQSGSGLVSHLGIRDPTIVQVGTLSKALGCAGGFVAGTAVLCRYLRHRARSFVFSTAPPPAVAAGALAALRLVQHGDQLRERLWSNALALREIFRRNGYNVPDGISPIIPIVVGDAAAAVQLSRSLLQQGVLIPAIRYPTVPPGQARLRVTASSSLTQSDVEWLEQALKAINARTKNIL